MIANDPNLIKVRVERLEGRWVIPLNHRGMRRIDLADSYYVENHLGFTTYGK